jgi:hypothetical protein
MIVSARIHPGIGVARIGDSKSEFLIGPEVQGALSPESLRDQDGALKRQAARFRVYGYDEDGEVVAELTSDSADITWTVHVANRKAAWYRFTAALDIPEAVGTTCIRRNSDVQPESRHTLVIDPGPKSIAGNDQKGKSEFGLDGGKFKDVDVSLGELQTDSLGRLLVLSGRGRSESPGHAPLLTSDGDSFNNADDWFDDTCDGPVTAQVAIDGREIPVVGAWVVVAPPNYAPDVISWRTITDLLLDLYVSDGWLDKPTPVRFYADVFPVLQRLSNLQWVNAGFAALFGRGRPMDFDDQQFVDKLAAPPTSDGADPYRELRQQLFNAFRPMGSAVHEPRLWPWIYGDAFGSFGAASPRNSLALPTLQEWILDQWRDGNFARDDKPSAAASIEEVPLADQPSMLDHAAMAYCLADAFHPGCELTWPMRHLSLYQSPFRIRARPDDQPEVDLGDVLTPTIALGLSGPLHAQPPGGLTRWMALPWQADTAFCRSGYQPDYDPYVPTFWPARVPNQVLSEKCYQIAIDTTRPLHERIAAYNTRDHWLRVVTQPGAGTAEVMQRMVDRFAEMGVVERREGVSDHPELPEIMLVENIPPAVAEALAQAVPAARLAPAPPAPVARAGWASAEQFEEFRSIRIRDR